MAPSYSCLKTLEIYRLSDVFTVNKKGSLTWNERKDSWCFYYFYIDPFTMACFRKCIVGNQDNLPFYVQILVKKVQKISECWTQTDKSWYPQLTIRCFLILLSLKENKPFCFLSFRNCFSWWFPIFYLSVNGSIKDFSDEWTNI